MIRELIIWFLEYQVPYISLSGLISTVTSYEKREGGGKQANKRKILKIISSSCKRLKGKLNSYS